MSDFLVASWAECLSFLSFPGSAWERAALEALPPHRRKAEPGNEGNEGQRRYKGINLPTAICDSLSLTDCSCPLFCSLVCPLLLIFSTK
jgi:hypothetical protein